MKDKRLLIIAWIIVVCSVGCSSDSPPHPSIPSLDYINRLKVETASGAVIAHTDTEAFAADRSDVAPLRVLPGEMQHARAGLKLIKSIADDTPTAVPAVAQEGAAPPPTEGSEVAKDAGEAAATDQTTGKDSGVSGGGTASSYYEYHSQKPNVRDYTGPLALGDPGAGASLWRESRNGNDLFRDFRAWQPMDLITIVVSETSQGSKTADTQVKEKSSVVAAISSLLGLEKSASEANKRITPSSLINASTQNDFKGEGETNRKDSLTAKISGMVVEVLPSGIIRVEGEKIISVNNEEQIMVISGLIRPRDINSANEVDSSKIANMRIDYYGRGTVGEAQNGGWGARLLRHVWPF